MTRTKSQVTFDGRAFVPEADYNALAARLAEAEKLLDEAEQWLGDNDDEEATSRRIRKFLKATTGSAEHRESVSP